MFPFHRRSRLGRPGGPGRIARGATAPRMSSLALRPVLGCVFGLALCLPLTQARAQPAQPAEAQAVLDQAAQQPVGSTTRALLEIQRSGAQAGPGLPMSGEQAALAYERHMASFRYAIPEFFTSQATGSALRGGSGGVVVNGK